MAMPLVSEARLKLFNDRQPQPAWGAEYLPAIRATREEAPRCSRPTVLHPRKLGGRGMHLLSDPETYSALLALHHSNVFDVHEQHVLAAMPTLHPLASLKDAKLLKLAHLPGTLAVADQLGRVAQHPKIFIEGLNETGEWVPFPYVGDLLLFLRDEQGPFCVNWTVKLEPSDFRRVGWRQLRRSNSEIPVDDMRHQLEKAYFAEAGVPTRQISLSQIDWQLRLNLRKLHDWDARPIQVGDSTRASITSRLIEIVGSKSILFDEIQRLAAAHAVPTQTVMWTFYSAVWRRELRVDLYRPLLMDRPLRAEQRDPLQDYASWFAR